ncbi:MAG TPA: hypothetical protein VGP79_04220, partial [Bryobacteraceae bacterium]|nr:hypothetical protein [Bryobacteraceae bacterium]
CIHADEIGAVESGKCLGEVGEQRRGVEEQVKVEVETIAGVERKSVQVAGAEDEWSRRIG